MQIKNPKYTNDGRIDCEILHPEYGWIPFTADSNDVENLGKEVYAKALALGPAPADGNTSELENEVRAKRNALLSGSDWTQIADAPVDQQAWAAYRQALRDIPEQPGFPHDIIWPVAPV